LQRQVNRGVANYRPVTAGLSSVPLYNESRPSPFYFLGEITIPSPLNPGFDRSLWNVGADAGDRRRRKLFGDRGASRSVRTPLLSCGRCLNRGASSLYTSPFWQLRPFSAALTCLYFFFDLPVFQITIGRPQGGQPPPARPRKRVFFSHTAATISSTVSFLFSSSPVPLHGHHAMPLPQIDLNGLTSSTPFFQNHPAC